MSPTSAASPTPSKLGTRLKKATRYVSSVGNLRGAYQGTSPRATPPPWSPSTNVPPVPAVPAVPPQPVRKGTKVKQSVVIGVHGEPLVYTKTTVPRSKDHSLRPSKSAFSIRNFINRDLYGKPGDGVVVRMPYIAPDPESISYEPPRVPFEHGPSAAFDGGLGIYLGEGGNVGSALSSPVPYRQEGRFREPELVSPEARRLVELEKARQAQRVAEQERLEQQERLAKQERLDEEWRLAYERLVIAEEEKKRMDEEEEAASSQCLQQGQNVAAQPAAPAASDEVAVQRLASVEEADERPKPAWPTTMPKGKRFGE